MHRLRRRAHFQADIHARCHGHLHRDIFLFVLAETRLFYREYVAAGREREHRVIAGSGSYGIEFGSRVRINHGDFGSGNQSACGVRNRTGNAAAVALCI